LLLEEAGRVGARRVVAETTLHNTAALQALRRCGAVLYGDGTGVRAEIPLAPSAGR